jgi:hypothetical protein
MPDVPVIEIVVRYNKNDTVICNLTFLFEDGTSKRLGEVNTDGRVDQYEFSEGEYIIGATLEHKENGYLTGFAFHTMKPKLI